MIERRVALEATTTLVSIKEKEAMISLQVQEFQKNDDNDLGNYLDDAVSCSTSQADTDEAGGLPIQLRQYLTRLSVNRKHNPNPFVVWELMKHEYPYLWNVTKKFLPIVTTSVPSGRLFSHAGLIAN
ncbi:Protein of unknown function [Cotesia congregata]|uniref:HAT C-terminal dimerisation domain-containing protein n=1 Tax=Cotesia congregata TaxID=51543 RepID=A0A8J2HBW1_COTCN|nr:Protein of unknown function [Cotesia congregata]